MKKIRISQIKLVSYTVFLRIEVALEFRPPSIRSLVKHVTFILKAIAYRISSNVSSKVTAEETVREIR